MAATKVVRMLEEDIEYLSRLSGLPEAYPFSMKVHVVLAILEAQQETLGEVRLALRTELERLLAGE